MRKRVYSSLIATRVNNTNTFSDTNHPHTGGHIFPEAVIHNLVGTTELFCSSGLVDLKYVASVLPNSFYDRQRFAAITIRIADPMCTALLFTSGKLVLTGSRSWCQCLLASLHIARLLTIHTKGVTFSVRDTSVQNIVGNAVISLKTGECLDLQMMYDALGTICTWQPNMFPGLVLRPNNSPVVLLCFYSGKVVVTGGKRESDIYDGWANLWPTVRRFIRLQSETSSKRQRGHPVESTGVVSDEIETQSGDMSNIQEKTQAVESTGVVSDAIEAQSGDMSNIQEKTQTVESTSVVSDATETQSGDMSNLQEKTRDLHGAS
jgi:transcription initiation factor TFIID TATA-box-binding protein